MGFLTASWRRIGARLYLALGFSVLLVILSSSVGVYYFERSIEISDRVRLLIFPSHEAAWSAAREVDGLRILGLGILARTSGGVDSSGVTASIGRLEEHLSRVSGSRALLEQRSVVQEDFYALVEVIDGLLLHRGVLDGLEADLAELHSHMDGLEPGQRDILDRGLEAAGPAALEAHWPLMSDLVADGVAPALVEEVYRVRAQQLELQRQSDDLVVSLEARGGVLEGSVVNLVELAGRESDATLMLSVTAFDRGRLILVVVSVVGVLAATLVAWFWVGRGVVRRLSLLSERMQGMAEGDIETPMPGISRDEIGQLAHALEVWRQQSIEVRRLNLVERLYGELNEAHEELKLMQDRLVAQEKLAALGELVSGVAHEISNPLNFVRNFSQGSQALFGELGELVRVYRDGMSEDDRSILDDIMEELDGSLERVQLNGSRALEIVGRMRDLGGGVGEISSADLNGVLGRSAEAACRAFSTEWEDFSVEPLLDLDAGVGMVDLVVPEFSKAVGNLVQNACYAMRLRGREQEGHVPELLVSSRLAGDRVEVRFRDNGTGIAPDVLPHIFNPFFTTRDGALGAGLGLPIAQDILRRLGGHLTVETQPGDHAEFLMEIPREMPVVPV